MCYRQARSLFLTNILSAKKIRSSTIYNFKSRTSCERGAEINSSDALLDNDFSRSSKSDFAVRLGAYFPKRAKTI